MSTETHGKDNSPDIIIKARRSHRLLMRFWCPGLLCQNKPRPNPHSTSTQHQRRRQTLPIEQSSGSNNLHRLSRHRTLLPLDKRHHGRYQHRGRHVAGVTATLATLRADDVDAEIETFLDVFGVSNHVHVEDTCFVELLHDVRGWNADGGDEETCAGVDYYVGELVELAVRVVVAWDCQQGKPRALGG